MPAKPRRKLSVPIRRGGRIVLPPGVSPFKVGQRVYFSVRSGSVVVGPVPLRSVNGRFISRRLKMGTFARESSCSSAQHTPSGVPAEQVVSEMRMRLERRRGELQARSSASKA